MGTETHVEIEEAEKTETPQAPQKTLDQVLEETRKLREDLEPLLSIPDNRE